MTIPTFVWLIVIPLAAAPAVYLAARLTRRPALARWAAAAVLAAAWVPLVPAARALAQAGTARLVLGTIGLRWDGLSLLLAVVALGLASLATIFSMRDIAGEAGEEKYYALLLMLTGILIGLGCAEDLFNLWIWFEALAVATYLLVAFYRQQPTALEAGVKYLVQSAAGSALVLLGIAFVLMQTGTLNLSEIGANAEAVRSPALLAAGALFIVGFGVKAALVPLHTWLPDAHSQAPSGISAMLSGVVIAAGLVAMLRALAPLVARENMAVEAGWLLMGLGAVNMLYGNLLALRQTVVKRMLAYSSLSHLGYMLLGLGITLYAGQAGGAEGGFFHLLNHGFMKGLAFLAAGTFVYALQRVPGQHTALKVSDLAGASQRYPLAALALSVAVLGLAGLPPLAGFMSKWQIFAAGFVTRDVVVDALVGFAALNSVLSLAYYAPLVNALYRLEPSPAVTHGRSIPMGMSLPLVVMVAAVLVIGVWPGLMQGLVQPASAAFLAAISH